MTTEPVRAAGAVLWRRAGDGIEICVVHRPYRADWSLPKGKLDGDEHPLAAAVREVLEETGVPGEPQLRLPEVRYTLPDGAPKTVEFWLMRAAEGPADDPMDPTEVDIVRWLSPADALATLTYPDDRRLVGHVAALPPITAVTGLVRHAHAGKRSEWDGDDALRPIDDRGRAEARTLGSVLPLIAPRRLVAATPLRCRQTLEPVAERLGLPIIADAAFAEPAGADEIPARAKAAAARLTELRDGPPVAVCSQGKVIPSLLALLDGAEDREPYRTPKGTGWILTWSGDRLLGLSRI
ncbi:NUDIX hydrolase [Amorphoplanes nipponensis]|uniref:Hydrolase MutT/NUDIX n=1 Tax=Actinoplanes nipponensis TaxID=135950 RepID=A0A919JPE3_9ACTN|nr:NUDIX hydrolase [Actinoplanes nipponensis]GIE52962.1 putative hydrolase MutT/NUDIX [Actinoplanes nipponensis]